MLKRLFLAVALLGLCLPAARPQTAPAPGRADEPASSGGVLALDRLLQKLAVHKRMLVIGAHPDDEDNRLLTLESRKMGAEVAYLSLSRGEGGQNLLGPHLGVPLGLIRTQELLAARRIDGGRQYFTRAYDFGYTRSLEETLSLWPKDVLLEDVTRIIRRFRPQVVVTVFSGTARDGHGQHQASGVVGKEAALADPDGHPDLEKEGLLPWKISALYCCGYAGPDVAAMVLPTGAIDPLSGRSYHQIAMASRSNHRSQDMGALQPPGPNQARLAWVSGGAGKDGQDPFAGIDTRLAAIAAGISDPGRRAAAEEQLRRVEASIGEARAKLGPASLDQTASSLSVALKELRQARGLARPDHDPGEAASAAFLDEKIDLAETALAAAAEVTVDAITDRETVAPGDSLDVKIVVWNGGPDPAQVEGVDLVSADGWNIAAAPSETKQLGPGTLAEWTRQVSPAGAIPTIPYFLRRPMRGALYDWGGAPSPVWGEPFQAPPLTAIVHLRVEGTELRLAREVVNRYRDQAIGEVRRPVRAVPALEVSVDPDRIVWPIEQKDERRLEVTISSNFPKPVSGNLVVVSPGGWPVISPIPFSLTGRGDRQFVDVPIRPPSPFPPGRGAFELAAVLPGGERYSSHVEVLDYPHIPPTPMPVAAEVEVVAADIRLPALKSVGYVRGASDRVPEALTAIGVPLHVLDEKDLDSGDLSRYDALVIGSRAYETNTALVRSNNRVLAYARNGGLVIVQYQQYAFVEGGFAPYKLDIARPHDRVTDEKAPVRVLDPKSPAFERPNRIGPADWNGWVQERGLYFAHTWDAAYAPLLEMNDPGQPPQRGGLLVAKLGKGIYVYTGLAFFRQLPGGVPGGYRLFANLLGLKSKHVTLRNLFSRHSRR